MSGRTLADLKIGSRARILALDGEGEIQQRLAEMGVIPGVEVLLVRRAPLGDPLEYELMGYRLSLRRTEASIVSIEDLS